MTFQTALVVISSILPERLMRIVTRRAAYPAIIRITLAVKNTIRLETHVVDFHALQQRKLFRAAMARRAKLLRQLIATQQAGIVDRLRGRVAGFDGGDVLSAWTMTRFASDSMCKLIQPQLGTAKNRTRRVTTETTRHLLVSQQSPGCISQ